MVQIVISYLNVELIIKNSCISPIPFYTIVEKENDKTVTFDQTMSLLLPLLATQGDSGSSKSNDMMIPLMLMLTQNGNSSDNSMLLPMMLLMK